MSIKACYILSNRNQAPEPVYPGPASPTEVSASVAPNTIGPNCVQ